MREIRHLAVLAVVIVAICIAGRIDYNDEVIGTMRQGTYEVLRERLGDIPRSELVDIYMSDKEYWDSLGAMR